MRHTPLTLLGFVVSRVTGSCDLDHRSRMEY